MKSALRRRQIRDCARKVFSQKGYHATTVADIIREAGVARGTFYRHYDGKRDVFELLIDEFFVSLELGIRRVDISRGAPPVTEQMLDNVHRVLRILFDNADLTRILLREAVGIDEEFDGKIDEFYSRILALIQRGLVLGQEMGIVRKCDTKIASLLVLGSVRQVMDFAIGSRRQLPAPQTVGRELLKLVAGGLFILEVAAPDGRET
jgi:AcrR family transcriptional regulator